MIRVWVAAASEAAEQEAAEFIRDNMSKPVAALIVGQTAPPGRRMGHAGAIIAGGKGTAEEKFAAMEEAGMTIARNPDEMGKAVQGLMG